jgi:1,4-alpha-glucan branching enzyme
MGVSKKYLSDNELCRVTFTLPAGLSKTAESANLVGDFNDWSITAHPMQRRKNGQFATSIDLPVNNEYQFRYLLDGNLWETDQKADEVVPAPFADQYNAVVKV